MNATTFEGFAQRVALQLPIRAAAVALGLAAAIGVPVFVALILRTQARSQL